MIRLPDRLRRATAAATLAAVTAIAILGTFPGAAIAVTQIEGEYQIQIDARKQFRNFPWDYDSNSDDAFGLVQFRIFSQPRADTEFYLKFEEDWNRGNNNGLRPEFQFREAHVRFRWEKDGHGLDTHLFNRQDRFWVDNHLIEVVRGDAVKDGDNAQGIRLDGWGWVGSKFTYIYSDFSSQSNPNTNDGDPSTPADTDDAHIFRARRDFFDRAVTTGLTYNRKVEAESRIGERGHSEVFAGDFRYTLRNIDFRIEYAESHEFRLGNDDPVTVPGRDPHIPSDGQFEAPEGFAGFVKPWEWLPSDAVLKAEIRSVQFGTPTFGYLNVAPFWWYAGPDYENPIGDALRDERGTWINSWYLVPQRAVTLSANYGRWKKAIFEQKDISELYTEMYVEFVNGFTGKVFHRRKKTRDHSIPGETEITRNYDLFVELQVESRLAWMRIQGKIKDMDTERRKELASLETAINLTPTLKLYNRFTFGNDPARLRDALFAELQYRPRSHMEMFLSYGPWWIGDSPNPVEDGDLEGSAENQDIIKFTLKGYF